MLPLVSQEMSEHFDFIFFSDILAEDLEEITSSKSN